MDIGIVGYGTVGGATAEVLRRLGHPVYVWDVNPARMKAAGAEGFSPLTPDLSPEVVFVCVPEQTVPDTLASMREWPLTVIRSTVPPGSTDRLSRELGRPLVFMPETLREATALSDALNPPFILIGTHDEAQGQKVAQLFAPLLAPTTTVQPIIAEMVKLTLNAYLHTLVSFWNEINEICELAGVPSHVVGKLSTQDPRVSTYGATMHGQPVGGKCLPKDLFQLVAFAQEQGYLPQLLQVVQTVNGNIAARAQPAKEYPKSARSPQLRIAG